MTENQVELIIKNMKSKHCELDCIPMHILMEMMPVVLPTITKIVNLSLSKGILSFLSKLVEKCMWLQLSNHCQDYGLLPDYHGLYENTTLATNRIQNQIQDSNTYV